VGIIISRLARAGSSVTDHTEKWSSDYYFQCETSRTPFRWWSKLHIIYVYRALQTRPNTDTFYIKRSLFMPCVGKLVQNVFIGYILIHLRPLCDSAWTVPRVLTYWASRTHCTLTQRYETWLNGALWEIKLVGTMEVQWRKFHIILWDWKWETGCEFSGRRHVNYAQHTHTHARAITRTQTHAHVCVMITILVGF
jgi:hypothetical protein